MTNDIEKTLKEFEKLFACLHKDQKDWNYWVSRAILMNDIKTFITQALKNKEEEVLKIIEEGGTVDTVLEIEHNGEKFINKRQLIKAIKEKENES